MAHIRQFKKSAKVYEAAEVFCGKGFKCHGIKANLAVREEVYRCFQECVEKLGKDLEILVTAHGIQRRHSAYERCLCFLASHASDYLGGAIIPVDGGYLVK